MELLGSGYVIDHCVSAFLEEQQAKSYRVYITDTLRAIVGANRLPTRYYDLVNIKPEATTKTAHEVISNFKHKFD